MRKTLLVSLVALFLLFQGNTTFAQSGPDTGRNPSLDKLAKELQQKYEVRQKQALELAKKNNWVVSKTLEDGTVIMLKGLRENGQPNYSETNNLRAAYTTKTNRLWEGGSLGLNLSGSTLSGKMAIWDGGMVRPTHQELKGRIVVRDTPTSMSDHATHVAGTMIATGVRPEAKGMAYKAQNLQSYDFLNDIPEMAVSAKDLLISNHSYGTIAGWRFNSARTGTVDDPSWEWWGDENINPSEDWKFGYYDEEAQDFDKIAYNAPYYLICKSSGNNRNQTGPAIGQPYWKINWNTFEYELVAARPANISNNNGYDIISTYGNAKNILTIGAINSTVEEDYFPGQLGLTTFSSWGPTDDGRIKPDVVGAGAALISSIAAADDAYGTIGGTSMSTPNVSGSLALLQEHYSQVNKGKYMRAATLKALAIHTADPVGTNAQKPTYSYGWGLLNATKAATAISNKDKSHIIEELMMQQGGEYTFQVVASGAGSLLATIAWTDPEGNVVPVSPQTINDKTPKLVNDLDIRIFDADNAIMPYILDPANPAKPATRGDNFRDNVEQVEVVSPVPGKTYTVTIRHKGTLARGPQAYSLIVSGINKNAYCVSQARNSADSKIVKLNIGGMIFQSRTTCATYTDFTADTTATAYLRSTLPISIDLGTCGKDFKKIAKVFIDWNSDGDFNDANELVATTPVLPGKGNLSVSVPIPSTVRPNNFARVRVVLVETNSADKVKACGVYSKGETWDLTIKFLQQPIDIAATGLITPAEGFCENYEQRVMVTVRNEGANPVNNVALKVIVRNSNQIVATLTDTIINSDTTRQLILPQQNKEFYMANTFAAMPGTKYTFEIIAKAANDNVAANDSITVTRTSAPEAAPPIAEAILCGEDVAILRGSGAGTVFWYNSPTNGELIAAGNNTNTTAIPPNKTFYAALNELDKRVGPKTKEFATGGGYNQYGPSIAVTAHVPVVIESARLYIGASGSITFSIENEQGDVVSSKTIEVTRTFDPTIPGPSPTVPFDTGRVYPLGLEFPEAGNYLISIEYDNTATIFRNNAGVTGYPFEIPGVFAITGNTAGANFYYYLYDVRVKGLGCPSPRIPVEAKEGIEAVATITVPGDTAFCIGDSTLLVANTGAGLTYQWLKDGEIIPNATDSVLNVKESGNYAVTVTLNNACFTTSEVTKITVHPLPPAVVKAIPLTPTHLCPEDRVEVLMFAAMEEDYDLYSYQWFYNNVPIANATDPEYVATEPGRYHLSVANFGFNCGATYSDTVHIIKEAPVLTVASASVCANETATLTASTNVGTIFWYDAPVNGNLVAVGDSVIIPDLTATKTYFVGVNDLRDTLDAPSYSNGGGFSSFTGGRMYFNAEIPFVLEKATVNAGTGGSMLIYVFDKDSSENIIAGTRITLTPGVKEYVVDLYIPYAGRNFGIQVVQFSGGATAFRNNVAGAVSFPYEIPGVVSITGTNQLDQSSFYYFLYNWQVSSAGCSTTQRTEVKAEVGPCIKDFTLVDADKNIDVKTLENGDKINLATHWKFNIRANTKPMQVGSVKFELDGKPYSVDNTMPYALAGDKDGKYNPALMRLGKHTLVATSYSQAGAAGLAGKSQTITFEVVDVPKVESFTLIDAKTDKVVGPLTDGMVVNIEEWKEINIKANTKPDWVAFVRFVLNGKTFNNDYLKPYALAGNWGNNYLGWKPKTGNYTLTAIPYSLTSFGQEAGEPLTVNFQVVKGATASTLARYGDPEEDGSLDNLNSSISVTPNPVENHLSLIFKTKEEGTMSLSLIDGVGHAHKIGKRELGAQQEVLEVDITSLDLPAGFYVLKIDSDNKPQRLIKILKK